MDGLTLNWHQWMHMNKQLSTWSKFKIDLLKRFRPSLYRDLFGELAKFQQTSTAQDFDYRFEELSNLISSIPSNFLQSCFESELRLNIEWEVRAMQPQSLLKAFQSTKLMKDGIFETQVTIQKKKSSSYNASFNANNI